MLILTRKLGESIVVGDEIKIHLLEVKGKQVRLGVEAPPHIIIHREEIYRLIREQNRMAVDPVESGKENLRDVWSKLTRLI